MHPNVFSISDLMLRLRGLRPMDADDAKTLRKAGWTIGTGKTYATCSTKLANGNRLEATVTTAGKLWIDLHNDGPSYNVAHGQDDARHIVGAAIIASSMLRDMHAGKPVAELHQLMLTSDMGRAA